jgi:hypothetical protein
MQNWVEVGDLGYRSTNAMPNREMHRQVVSRLASLDAFQCSHRASYHRFDGVCLVI